MYKPTIGLEIHAELSTKSKMFCSCPNVRDDREPNKNVCEICLGHPGTLPTINREAVRSVIKLGLALGGKIPEFAKFDRKNYFYPDLPKGYQISQYDMPLVQGGELVGVKITRVHLEEDTGRLIHDKSGNSLVDFNRAGRPLMELVTEPVITSADQALTFAKELQLILRYLEISHADMEHGEMRVEANISISKDKKRGTKVEVKNLNSFRAVAGAIAYEIKRQEEVLENGGKVTQETRGWDDAKQATYSQRTKEEAHDYRYLPEPDLPPLKITKKEVEEIKVELPELPAQKRERFQKEFNLRAERAEILVSDRFLAKYFEEVVSELDEEMQDDSKNVELVFNYLTSDLLGLTASTNTPVEKIKITPEDFADLIALIVKGELGSRAAKDILAKMFVKGGDPREIMKDEGLSQISDEGELKKVVSGVIVESEKVVADYKKGKTAALEALVGRAMGKLKGRGNPEVLRKLFISKLTS
ncbi:MAG: Asp-tRNA(Asn)/Glu-tRNA(Gln) amidotransferase subunit GatB [Candidatus Colwellbacteria bacterium]|nr:Asp-tRNA(Asn)/Glu-tRNA(Gln) amidotransferase subunit GatB [Candidatus Colwellbacteria bacterium]